jgi:hypothetical protein
MRFLQLFFGSNGFIWAWWNCLCFSILKRVLRFKTANWSTDAFHTKPSKFSFFWECGPPRNAVKGVNMNLREWLTSHSAVLRECSSTTKHASKKFAIKNKVYWRTVDSVVNPMNLWEGLVWNTPKLKIAKNRRSIIAMFKTRSDSHSDASIQAKKTVIKISCDSFF